MSRLFFGLNETLDSLGVDAESQQEIPVRFYGTAGMRTVSPIVQNRTYSIVTDWITDNTLFTDIQATTIPGEYEALYDWLAVNYLNGAFANNASTAAVFDLGGGSSEIAYETSSTNGPNVYAITVANKTHLTAALPWFTGNDWARNQYLDHEGCFPVDYPMPDLRSYSGNFQDCQISVDSPFVTNSNLHPMTLSVPFVSQDVHLISTFYYAYDAVIYFGAPMPTDVNFNITAFHLGAEQYCNTSREAFTTGQSPYSAVDVNYANTYCFGSALIESVYNRMELDELSADHNLWVTKKINGTTVSGLIGVVVQLMTGAQFSQLPSNQLPTFAPTTTPTATSNFRNSSIDISSPLFIGCVVAGGLVLLAAVLVAKNWKHVSESFKSCRSTVFGTGKGDNRQALLPVVNSNDAKTSAFNNSNA